MKELTNRLMMFTTNDNALIIDTLVSEIIDNNISSLEELKVLEHKYYNNLSLDKRVELAYKEMILDTYKFDNMNSLEINKYDEMKELFDKSSNLEEKIILIIKLYELLHYQMKFLDFRNFISHRFYGFPCGFQRCFYNNQRIFVHQCCMCKSIQYFQFQSFVVRRIHKDTIKCLFTI